ncbi:MAG: hypothetical protein NVS2B12_08860 [Ktedonobacteraceae bacterium]
MTIEQYYSALRRWKLIVLCIVILGIGAYVGSKFITPIYQSTVLIQVTIRSETHQADDINSLLASNQLVQTESLLAVSDPILRQVASRYANISADMLAKNVSVVVKPNTQLFEIHILDTDPKRAAALANDIAGTLIKQQTGLMQHNNGQLHQTLQKDLQQTQQQMNTAIGQITDLKSKKDIARATIQEADLYTMQEHYRQVQSQLTALELTEIQGSDFLHLAQPAQPALSPVQPNVFLNTVIGLLAGLLTGILLAMLLEQLDTRVRNEDILARIVNWPVLSTIWRQHNTKKGKSKDTELVDLTQHSENIEPYRILRTNIGFSALSKPIRTMAVVSAVPSEGKSFVAANLAIFMARAGKKTLLIDSDLRRPTVGKKFHLFAEDKGLSNAVIDCNQYQLDLAALASGKSKKQLQDSFSLHPYMYEVNIPDLFIMPSGLLPPDPSELLASKAMDHFMTTLGNSDIEMVIFDTPPLLGISDANILIPRVDGVLVVIDINTATKKNLQRVKTQLAQSGSHVLGCVINKKIPNRRDMYNAYYYSDEEKGRSENAEKEKVESEKAEKVVVESKEMRKA